MGREISEEILSQRLAAARKRMAISASALCWTEGLMRQAVSAKIGQDVNTKHKAKEETSSPSRKGYQ